MPFPSRACKNCKIRRIKCDEKSPVCGGCERTGRDCTGVVEQGNLQYRSENAYAGGVPRRPRPFIKGKPNSNIVSPESTGNFEGEECSKTATNTERSLLPLSRWNRPKRSMQIPKYLDVSLEEKAVNHYVHNWMESSNEPHTNIHSFLKEIGSFSTDSKPTASMLELSVSALSFAIYGRTKITPPASLIGAQKYAQALEETKKAIVDPGLATSDHLLLTVMMLSAYENVSCIKLDHIYPLLDSFRHQRGAIAIIELRKKQGQRSEMKLPLEKQIRREIIKAAVLNSQRLPSILVNGTEFGEVGIDLDLDACLVKVTQLRSWARKLFHKTESIPMDDGPSLMSEVLSLAAEAQTVDEDLAAWAAALPQEWLYLTQSPSKESSFLKPTSVEDIIYDGTLHLYPSLSIVTIWNRWRGARLVASNILAKALLRYIITTNQGANQALLNQRETAENTIQTLVDDLCNSVSFHFGRVEKGTQQGARLVETARKNPFIDDITARKAFLLVWPLTIASVSLRICERQKEWIRYKIILISRITGNGALEALATLR